MAFGWRQEGKSIVLIKIIEYLYYLQSKGLIPKDIMLYFLGRSNQSV